MATPFSAPVGSATVSATEFSLPNNASYSSGSPVVGAIELEPALDLSGMIAGDQIQVTIYDKVNGGTQAPIYRCWPTGTQSRLYTLPPKRVKEGWDVTIKLIAGAGSTVKWSLREDLGDRNIVSVTAGAIGGAAFGSDVGAKVSRTNTAQAGGASTITLDAGASAVNSFYNDLTVYLVSGTGAGQTRTVTGYVGATKVATVDSAWGTNPDATSVFQLIPVGAAGSGGGASAATIAAAVWDEVRASHVTSGSFGEGINVVSIATAAANTVRDALLNFAHRTGRTFKGFIRRVDTFVTNRVDGLNGATVTFYQPDGTTEEFHVSQDAVAGTRATGAVVTNSET